MHESNKGALKGFVFQYKSVTVLCPLNEGGRFNANERWFFEITKSTIVTKSVQGTWCNADSLTVTEKVEKTLHLGNAKDYGPRSLFMQE